MRGDTTGRRVRWLAHLGAGLLLITTASAAPPNLQQISSFITDQYSYDLQLCAEAPIAAPNTYWLLNDNLEAAVALAGPSPSKAYNIAAALYQRGYMTNDMIEALHGQGIPWPPRTPSVVVVEDNLPNYIIQTEVRDGGEISSWSGYGDLVAMRAIALANEGDTAGADTTLDTLFAMWDGVGIDDAVHQSTGIYATYKLALLLIAADEVGKTVPFRTEIEDRLGLQQRADGGIITDYQPDGTPTGDANVETSSLTYVAMLGDGLGDHNLVSNGTFELEALPGNPGAPLDWFHSADGWDWTTATHRSGSHAIVLNDASASAEYDWRSLAFPVTPGEQLRATVYCQRTVASGALHVMVRFFLDAEATQFVSEVSTDITGSTADFEPTYLFGIEVPAGAAYCDVRLITDGPTIGTFVIDDVFVGRLPDASQPDEFALEDFNRVANSTVEMAGEPGYPASWYHAIYGTVWDTSQCVSPTHCLKIEDYSYSESSDWRSIEFAVAPGERLTLSYYTDYLAVSLNFGAFIRYFDANGTWLGQDTDLISGTRPLGDVPFEYRELHGVVPEGAVTADVFIFTNDVFNTGEAYYDDIRVDDNLVRNARMELGNGDDPDDWFHGAMTSREMPWDAPTPFYVIQIDDDDPNGYTDWRCKPFDITGLDALAFGFRSKRTDLVGEPVALLRFWEDVDASGDNPVGFVSEVPVPLSGDTNGFEVVSLTADVPAGAAYADVVFATFNDAAITGTLQFDDVVVVPTESSGCPNPGCEGGDIDGDCDVDLSDLAMLLAAYNTCDGDAGYDPAADFDASGCVDLADLASLLAVYGMDCN